MSGLDENYSFCEGLFVFSTLTLQKQYDTPV